MALLTLFAGVGLAIAAAGIYGVASYIAAQRTREIGLRIALGATSMDAMGIVLKRIAAMMVVGVLIGAAGAALLTSTLEAFVFQIEPDDPRILLTAVAVLAVAGLLASAAPIHRAAHVDPVQSLRRE